MMARIEVSDLLRCYTCGHEVAPSLVQRRRAVYEEHEFSYGNRFTTDRRIVWRVANFCPPCAAYKDFTEGTQARRKLIMIGGAGLAVFGLLFIGKAALIPALIVIMLGACYRRKMPVPVLPDRR